MLRAEKNKSRMNFSNVYIPSTLGIEQDILQTVENADIEAAGPIAPIHDCYYR